MVDCSIIIVNWNVREYLKLCLDSIHRRTNAYTIEVIVVDNGSTDGSLEMLRDEYPWVQVKAQGMNRGFARANNIGLAQAQGRYVFILNPDTELHEGVLESLISFMDDHPGVAVAAPQIVNADGSFQKGSIRRDPTITSQVIILLKLQYLLSHVKVMRRYYADDFDPSLQQDIDQPMGAAMFIRKEVLDRIGFFDEGFFLWFEEVDLSKRFREAGERIRYIPHVLVTHHGGRSFSQSLPLVKQKLFNRSALHYYSKHYGLRGYLSILATVPLNLVMVAVYQRIRGYGK